MVRKKAGKRFLIDVYGVKLKIKTYMMHFK